MINAGTFENISTNIDCFCNVTFLILYVFNVIFQSVLLIWAFIVNVYVLARILSTKELRVASFYHIGLYTAVQILSVVFGAPQVIAAFILAPPIGTQQINIYHPVLDNNNNSYNWTPPFIAVDSLFDIIQSDYNVNRSDYIGDFGWSYHTSQNLDLENVMNSFNVNNNSNLEHLRRFPNSTIFFYNDVSPINTRFLTESGSLLIDRIDFNFSCTTMLAIALERYIYICRATDAGTLLSKKRHKVLCFSTTVLTLILSTPAVVTGVKIEQNNATRFDSGVKLIQSVYWVISIFTSLGLYVKIILRLKQLRSNAEQNSKLNKAFIASWVAWFLFWTPEILMRVAFSFFTEFTLFFVIRNVSLYSAMEPFLNTSRLLSNVITPSLFIFISPPFQAPILDVIKKVTRG